MYNSMMYNYSFGFVRKDRCFKLPLTFGLTGYQRHKRRPFLGGLWGFFTSSLLLGLGGWCWVTARSFGGMFVSSNCTWQEVKGKRQPACWPEAPRAEGSLLREPGCPSCPGQVPPGMIQSNVGCGIPSFIPPVGFVWGRSQCQAVLSFLTPVLPLVPQEISLGCRTGHCRLQSLSASKWPFPYLENHG